MEMQGNQNSKYNLETIRIIEGHTLPGFKTYYKAAVISIVQYQYNNRYIKQWN